MRELAAHDLGELDVEIVPVAVVDPGLALRVPIVVRRAVDGREPHLARRPLAVQDEAHPVGELERQLAIAGRVIDLVGIEAFEPRRNALQTGLGAPLILLRVHRAHAGTLAHRHTRLQHLRRRTSTTLEPSGGWFSYLSRATSVLESAGMADSRRRCRMDR